MNGDNVVQKVKTEKFGTRNSLLKPLFLKHQIPFISGIWIVTCRQAINQDEQTRYLIITEGQIKNELKHLLHNTRTHIPFINVNFDEKNQTVSVTNLRTGKAGTILFKTFKQRLIELTECRFIRSFAQGSSRSTPLSRFFRENMGKGFALTDIDFYLPQKNLFIEEKDFTLNNKGYLGIGQCASFKEIINHIFKNTKLLLICVHNGQFFMRDFCTIDCRQTEEIPHWGKMVSFTVSRITVPDLLNILKH